MEGYQKSGTVQFAILVPFTPYDNGNGHNCVPYRTVLNRTAQWKRAIRDTSYELGTFFNNILSDHFCSGSNIFNSSSYKNMDFYL